MSDDMLISAIYYADLSKSPKKQAKQQEGQAKKY